MFHVLKHAFQYSFVFSLSFLREIMANEKSMWEKVEFGIFRENRNARQRGLYGDVWWEKREKWKKTKIWTGRDGNRLKVPNEVRNESRIKLLSLPLSMFDFLFVFLLLHQTLSLSSSRSERVFRKQKNSAFFLSFVFLCSRVYSRLMQESHTRLRLKTQVCDSLNITSVLLFLSSLFLSPNILICICRRYKV